MKKCITSFLIAMAFFSSCCCNQNTGGDVVNPIVSKPSGDEPKDDSYYPKASSSFRLVTYNVGAFSKYMTTGLGSTKMIAGMLKEVHADVIGINECDSCNTRNLTNQVANLARELGDWDWWFGRAMPYKNGAYGNGALVPKGSNVIAKYTVALDKGSGSEPRSIAVIETDRFVVGAAHLDHKSKEAQLAQARQVSTWAQDRYRASRKPVFFMGDMNAYPDSETIAALKEKWDLLSVTNDFTYPSTEAKKCIDYIFHYKDSAPVRLVGSQVMKQFKEGDVTKASDHLPVYVDIELNF